MCGRAAHRALCCVACDARVGGVRRGVHVVPRAAVRCDAHRSCFSRVRVHRAGVQSAMQCGIMKVASGMEQHFMSEENGSGASTQWNSGSHGPQSVRRGQSQKKSSVGCAQVVENKDG